MADGRNLQELPTKLHSQATSWDSCGTQIDPNKDLPNADNGWSVPMWKAEMPTAKNHVDRLLLVGAPGG
ncbi:Hypothetical predicted protein [Pelobates cultripes]|uniref:Uncharacterized protein n=1 Tax=Pelobates cultripes TaxID=61616 RepID=A0AAD1QXW4_PELCU|nr:Hypothetical predicted protein [Pelobates cultripes]